MEITKKRPLDDDDDVKEATSATTKKLNDRKDRIKTTLFPVDAYTRHKILMNQYVLNKPDFSFPKFDVKTDLDVLKAHHQFLWDSDDDEPDDGSGQSKLIWGQRIAKKYYDRLYKEYCICDLSRYKENKIAMRWRVEKEVILGKGQFICGNKVCDRRDQLRSWEVNFAYKENDEKKNALHIYTETNFTKPIFTHSIKSTADLLGSVSMRDLTLNGVACLDSLLFVGTTTGAVLVFEMSILESADGERSIAFRFRECLKQHHYSITYINSATDLVKDLHNQLVKIHRLSISDALGNISIWHLDGIHLKFILQFAGFNNYHCVSTKFFEDLLIASYSSGHIRLFSLVPAENKHLPSKNLVCEVSAHSKPIQSMDICSETGLLITTAEDTFVRVWLIKPDADCYYLNVNERSVAKNVCRQWQFDIERIDRSQTSLFVCPAIPNYSQGKRWSFTNQLIGYWNSITVEANDCFIRFQHKFDHQYFQQIKRLKIAFPHRNYVLTSHFVNQFAALEHLETNCLNLNPKFYLDLPQLQMLTMKNIDYDSLVISSPNLTVLIFYPCKMILEENARLGRPLRLETTRRLQFAQPVYLEHLECEEYPMRNRVDQLHLSRLRTLLCLKMRSVEPNLLEQLPALTQLEIAICNRREIDQLNAARNDSRRFDLNLIFLNFEKYRLTEMNDEHRFLTYFFINGKHVDYRLNELSKSVCIPYRISLYYNGLHELLRSNAKFQQFFTKLTRIYKVEVFNETNAASLIAFLSQCRDFKHLELYNTSLGQPFYDRLPAFKSISFLEIKEDTAWHIYNYDFLRGLLNLRTIIVHYDGLSIDLQIILTFIEHAFLHCKNLDRFIFGCVYTRVCIVKYQKDAYSLSIHSENWKTKSTPRLVPLHALLEHLISVQSDLIEAPKIVPHPDMSIFNYLS